MFTTRSFALLLSALVAGCNGGGDDTDTDSDTGGASTTATSTGTDLTTGTSDTGTSTIDPTGDTTTDDATSVSPTTDPSTTDAPTTDAPTTGDSSTGDDSTSDGTTGSAALSFATDVYPAAIQGFCNCHNGQGKLNLTTPELAYASFVDVDSGQVALKIVAPGDAENSYLLAKLNGTSGELGGNATQMPKDAPPLSTEQIDLVQQWIAGGALP